MYYCARKLSSQTALAYARVWHHVDASERVLGKLAERIAIVLMGKHKPIFDPSGTLDSSFMPLCKASLCIIVCS